MIFAAGLGTRLKPITDNCPKALVRVNNITLLEHCLLNLQQYGIYDVIINVHHFANKIIQTLIENNNFGSRVTISDERSELLDTGGGLNKAGWYFENESSFLILNVDILTSLNLGKLIEVHSNSKSVATLAVMNRDSARQLLFDEKMQLCGWMNNKTNEQRISKDIKPLSPYSFSGISVLSQTVLWENPFNGVFSLIDLYLYLAKNYIITGYDHTGDIFIDVGKPGSIEKAEQLF